MIWWSIFGIENPEYYEIRKWVVSNIKIEKETFISIKGNKPLTGMIWWSTFGIVNPEYHEA
jgi:hypothetical protein